MKLLVHLLHIEAYFSVILLFLFLAMTQTLISSRVCNPEEVILRLLLLPVPAT